MRSIKVLFGFCIVAMMLAGMYIVITTMMIDSKIYKTTAPEHITETESELQKKIDSFEKCPKPFQASSITLPSGVKVRYYVDHMPVTPTLKPTASFKSHDLFNISISEFQQKIHSDVPPVTLRGYNGMSPGPTIYVVQGRRTIIHWKNDIPADSQMMPNIETIPANLSTTGIVTHLHGTYTDDYSDGLPLNTVQSGETFSAIYNNKDNPMTLFYHDHAYGITRANVYKGLSGLYIISSPFEAELNLPTGVHDVPLLIQDRILQPDNQGNVQLHYPDLWTEEWFGDTMMVNGVIWPYKNVTATKYRFRIVNGANSRFLNLFFSNKASFTVITNDQGYLQRPVVTTSILLAPAERADIIIDLCKYAGTSFELLNDAAAPYPNGSDENYHPCLSGRIALFTVSPLKDQSCRTKSFKDTLNLTKAQKSSIFGTHLSSAVRVRDLVLVQEKNGMPMIGNRNTQTGRITTHVYEEPATEIVQNGTTELWRIFNLTPDTHPMHLHMGSMKIAQRQSFDHDAFKSGKIIFTQEPKKPLGYENGAKDTIRCDANVMTSFLVKFGAQTGTYMWHCHMLEHEENMMMRPLVIVPRNDNKASLFDMVYNYLLSIFNTIN
ncbi:hypothetical protein AKO1_010560 [Acrasis kona]|uniref:Uncharacterized protein n=1 Tax=Acrasis kona TaxID=1008807 RepID=A0AAW2ZJJ2_9EUKA